MRTELTTVGSGNRCQQIEGTVGLQPWPGCWAGGGGNLASNGPSSRTPACWPRLISFRGPPVRREIQPGGGEGRTGYWQQHGVNAPWVKLLSTPGWPEFTPEGPASSKSGGENVLPGQCLWIMLSLILPYLEYCPQGRLTREGIIQISFQIFQLKLTYFGISILFCNLLQWHIFVLSSIFKKPYICFQASTLPSTLCA